MTTKNCKKSYKQELGQATESLICMAEVCGSLSPADNKIIAFNIRATEARIAILEDLIALEENNWA